MNGLTEQLPKVLTGQPLKKRMTYYPDYKNSFRSMEPGNRLMMLSDLTELYIPCSMSYEIYSKVYLSVNHSINKKDTKDAVRQRNYNHTVCKFHGKQKGILGGSDCFTVTGISGIGKSSALFKSVEVAAENRLLVMEKPHIVIIPCIIIQCPHDCSVKGMLLEILRQVDKVLGSAFYERALRNRTTTDMLIGNVSQVALNHIGLLVIDEIQNVCGHRNGPILVAALTQLINDSGISLCMVGLPETSDFFSSQIHLARRTVGLSFHPLEYGTEFLDICKRIWDFQYTSAYTELNDGIIEWLYEHSAGIIAILLSLFMEAQQMAIMTGKEVLDLEILKKSYTERFNNLHDFIRPSVITGAQTGKMKKSSSNIVKIQKGHNRNREDIIKNRVVTKENKSDEVDLYDFIMKNRNQEDFLNSLKHKIHVTEIQVNPHK